MTHCFAFAHVGTLRQTLGYKKRKLFSCKAPRRKKDHSFWPPMRWLRPNHSKLHVRLTLDGQLPQGYQVVVHKVRSFHCDIRRDCRRLEPSKASSLVKTTRRDRGLPRGFPRAPRISAISPRALLRAQWARFIRGCCCQVSSVVLQLSKGSEKAWPKS